MHQVAFAARLSVARTEATEGEDATLDFPVTLAPAVSGTVTVQYATSDGTATAGEDYTTTTGTLTFSPNETAKTVSVPIIDDTEEDSGETVTLTLSNPTGAVLGDAEATGTILNTETSTAAAALTASFQDVPASHDGDSTFTFGLRFSEDVEGLSYVTLRDDAFEVDGGEVANARRKTKDRNQSWEIEVEPDGSGAVTITLPAGAVETTDGRSLAAAVSATVAGPGPLTASFEDVPASHDGDGTFTLGLQFSEDVKGLSYVTLRDDAFEVDGGEVANARRKTKDRNRSWEIEVEPDGSGAVTITLPAGAVETTRRPVAGSRGVGERGRSGGRVGRRCGGRRGRRRAAGLRGHAEPRGGSRHDGRLRHVGRQRAGGRGLPGGERHALVRGGRIVDDRRGVRHR